MSKFLLINLFKHLHSHSESINDTIERTNAGHDYAIFHFGDIGLGGVDAPSLFRLRYLCLLASIEQYLPRIKRESIFLRLYTLRHSFLAVLLVKYKVVVNDLTIVCLHNMLVLIAEPLPFSHKESELVAQSYNYQVVFCIIIIVY